MRLRKSLLQMCFQAGDVHIRGGHNTSRTAPQDDLGPVREDANGGYKPVTEPESLSLRLRLRWPFFHDKLARTIGFPTFLWKHLPQQLPLTP